MLDLDTSAIRALADLQRAARVHESGGLRIALADRPERTRFTLALVPGAADGDHVVAADGARVFLTPPVAGELADKVLQARVDIDGNVHFGVRGQG